MIKQIKYVTDSTVNVGTIELFNEIGIDVEILNIKKFKRTKNDYFGKNTRLDIYEHFRKNEVIFIDDFLTDKQRLSVMQKLNVRLITRGELSKYSELLSFFSSTLIYSMEKEIINFLPTKELRPINVNEGLVYLHSYDEDLIQDVLKALKIGEVPYRYKKSNEYLELYPNLSKRLPMLVNALDSKLVFVNNSIIPVDNIEVARDLTIYESYNMFDFQEYPIDCYNSEYVYLVRLSDMQDETFVSNLKDTLSVIVDHSENLYTKHMNIVFLSYDVSDFMFFSTHQDLFGEALFDRCRGDIKDILALSLFEVNGDNEALFSNMCTYFNHVMLDNTVSMSLRIPFDMYKHLDDFLNLCRIHSKLKCEDSYLIEANVPSKCTNVLLPFEEYDEQVY